MNARVLAPVLVGTVLIAVFVAAYLLHRHEPMSPTSTGPSERRVLYWHDPMVPNARFDKPGKSPFMDMQLVPVYADEGSADGSVRVAANVAQNLGVRLGKAEQVELQPRIRAVGTVAFDDRLLQVLPARADGVLVQLQVRSPLEVVSKGQPLATVQLPAWVQAKREYLALISAESPAGGAMRSAARERLRILGVPDAEVADLETRQGVEHTNVIVSPADGVVTELNAREGATFMAGTALFRINGLDSVWVNARIPESQLSLVREGAQVSISVAGWPGEVFPGTVIAILPQVDAQTRTVTARIAVTNSRRRLLPGMFATVEVAAPRMPSQIVVPDEAVIETGVRSVVIAVADDGSYAVVPVRIGVRHEGRAQILSGLAVGQTIVLSGQFLIDSEASLKATAHRLQAPTEQAGSAQLVHHRAEGTVSALDAESITLDHGPVPSLQWPSMNMRFAADLGVRPDGIKVGDRIEFWFVTTESGYRIERMVAAPPTSRGEPQ